MRLPRPLSSVLKGLASLALALLVFVAIEEGAKAHRRHGNTHLAADTLAMRWSPAVFALAGALYLGRGLAQTALLPLRRTPRQLRGPSTGPGPELGPPPIARLSPAPLDRYGQACRELGVEPGSPWATIRTAWRRSLPQWHPDAGGDPELWHRRMAAYRLLEAWEELRT